MKTYEATEEAYKNGYEKGYEKRQSHGKNVFKAKTENKNGCRAA